MKGFTILLVCFCFFIINLSGQSITGKVSDSNGMALANSTVFVLQKIDSSIVKIYVADSNGNFRFQVNTQTGYILKITHEGYFPFYREIIQKSIDSVIQVNANLRLKVEDLEKIVVVNSRPIIEVKADKIVLNIDGTINSTGSNSIDLLRKAPGVMIDFNDDIMLLGGTPQIQINGKNSPLKGDALKGYLKSLQSTQLDAIEVISNPSAKYDASGTGGIINIKLKKNQANGTNGSISTNYNIGTYSKVNSSFSLNHRNDKVNVYGNINYDNSLNANTVKTFRVQADSIFDQSSRTKNYSEGLHLNGGLDYFVNSTSTLGFSFNLDNVNTKATSISPMNISSISPLELKELLYTRGGNSKDRRNILANVNYRFENAKKTILSIDLDVGDYSLKNSQLIINSYYSPDMLNKRHENSYETIFPNTIKIYSFKVDFEKKINNINLEAGSKVGYTKTSNDFERYNIINDEHILDRDQKNLFGYRELISAAYLNLNRSYRLFMVQLGFRFENTWAKSNSTEYEVGNGNTVDIRNDSGMTRAYSDFFPNLAITFNKNVMSQVIFSYSPRISRPAYEDLNPFVLKLDDYNSVKGNSNLRPEYTNSFSVSHILKFKLFTSLKYSHSKNVFAQITDTASVSKTVYTKNNLASKDNFTFSASYSWARKWYSLFVNVNSYYSKFVADFGGGNRNIDQRIFGVASYIQNSFNLGSTVIELSGFYNSPTIWQGISKNKSIYSVDLGVKKGILKGKMDIKMLVSDLFKSLRYSGESNFSGINLRTVGRWESQQLKVFITWRFGGDKIKAYRKRQTGIENERKRTTTEEGIPIR